MPLMKSKSKQAFENNLKAEEKAGKPMKQSLAIAYAVKKKAGHKKMADGGPVSAKAESRPMPEQKHNDAKDVSQNDSKKALSESKWTDRPDMVSRKGMRTTPIKHPSMVPTSAFSTRLRSEEDELERSAKPNNGPQEEPPRKDDEMRPDRQGPASKDLKLKMMAEGGRIKPDKEHLPVEDHEAGPAEEQDMAPAIDPEDGDDMEKGPSSEEFMSAKMADGGEVDSMDQPMSEEEIEHHADIASAIMARMKSKKMAEGGEISLDSEEEPETYEHDNEAALKENYDSDIESMHQPMDSNEHGDKLEDEDSHDMVSRIMKKMKSKSPMVK